MVRTERLAEHPHLAQIRLLLLSALLIFVFTVVIGILNGTDLVEFSHRTLLTHVHTGTLGWITTSVFAATLWLFGSRGVTGWKDSLPRLLAPATVVAVVAYNVMFFTTTGSARPTVGGFVFLVIFGWLAWLAASLKGVVLSVPRLGMLAALATATFGGLLGVLLGVMIATGNEILPGDAYGSHPATMVIGFLIPTGMALAEWHLRPELLEEAATRAGWAQIGLPFIGGLCVTIGLLSEIEPLIIVSLPFEIIGVGIMVARLWPGVRNVRMADGSSALLAAPTVFWLIANIFMFIYLIGKYQGDFDNVPTNLILALDHMMFIGVMSNSLFAQARAATPQVGPQAVRILFFAMNIGLAGFALGLLADTAVLKRIFTPIMGLGILFGVAVCVAALAAGDKGGSEPAPSVVV
jgi:hypothetical protein